MKFKFTIMNNKLFFIIILAGMILFLACQKDNTPSTNGTGDVKIISLTASDTVLNVWVSTKITVTAEGNGLEYNWEADHGEINGSGEQIEYMAGTCCTGINTITCTVSNSTNSDSEKIKIRILPF